MSWQNREFVIEPTYYAGVLKFRAYEYGMPCALEINCESRLKEKHVKSFSSTTKNIYPLQECLWPPNMAG